jgi:EAL domain-containing protein (putative c-di-GMP-specific phosphodiesterase class I)/CheY-like chemotaxis protein
MSANHASADRLLVLDDTPELAELIGELGEKAGFDAHVTTDIDSFNEALERDAPDVIALDLQMPGTDGIEVLRQLAATACNAKVLLVTGMDRQTVISAKRFGRQLGLNLLGAVQKPFTPEALIAALSQGRSATGQLCANDLEEAIESGKLVLRYQPVVRLLESRVWHAESVEALPRWNHPEFGVLTPTQFIPLIASEKSALMRHLSDFVLVHGAQQLRQWQSTGVHLGLRVNIPAGLIGDTDFPDRLERLLDEQSIDLALLTLELSDVASLVDSSDGVEILTRLRLKGVKVSLDDFGDGSCAIPPLYTLPISEVKIDRRLTADLVHESGAATVFKGILNLLRDLDIDCCAEGVESREQLDALDALQCTLSQGFYIGTPMPAGDIPKLLTVWTANRNPHTGTGT